MRRLGIIAATVIAFAPFGSTIAHAAHASHRLPAHHVSASRDIESTITIALVDPHYPAKLDADAQALVADVNAERAKRGLAPLQRDAALDEFAHAKAADMASRGYFGHTSPEGITFQQRMRSAGWPTPYVAENIAFDVSEPAAHAAFVNSPPHYTNLIDPNERRIGVAVVTVGNGETFYVEDFSS
ncbi:MAG TPA: CAP domain-containing protein [Candidatus Elarobacter sp.]